MITNHLRLYALIYFICTDTNKRIIENHTQFSITENIIQKSRLMLLCSIYSIILLYMQIYTCAHSYIQSRQEISPYDFHYILNTRISSACKQILSHHSQKLDTFLKTQQHQMALLQTQDGEMPTTGYSCGFFASPFNTHLRTSTLHLHRKNVSI